MSSSSTMRPCFTNTRCQIILTLNRECRSKLFCFFKCALADFKWNFRSIKSRMLCMCWLRQALGLWILQLSSGVRSPRMTPCTMTAHSSWRACRNCCRFWALVDVDVCSSHRCSIDWDPLTLTTTALCSELSGSQSRGVWGTSIIMLKAMHMKTICSLHHDISSTDSVDLLYATSGITLNPAPIHTDQPISPLMKERGSSLKQRFPNVVTDDVDTKSITLR